MSLLTSNDPTGIITYIPLSVIRRQGSQCQTLVAPCSPRIQPVSTYSLYRERPPEAQPSAFNADQNDWTSPEVDFPLHEDPRTSRHVQHNLAIRACLPQPHSERYVIWGSFSMECEGNEGNEPVPIWCCNPFVNNADAPHSIPNSIVQLCAHRHCYNSICMHDIDLTMMQHWAEWRTMSIGSTPSKMFSSSAKPAKSRKLNPMPWNRTSWTSER